MSDGQRTWQPVDELIHIHDAAAVSQYTLVVSNAPETYLEIDSAGDMAGVRLPDDLRLCRRVPGVSVPVTEIKTLLYVLEAWHRYNSGGDIPSHTELRDMAIVKDWLDAQVKQEDSESE